MKTMGYRAAGRGRRIQALARGLVLGLAAGLAAGGCASARAARDGAAAAIERITVNNGAEPVYRFTLPEGAAFGDYTRITARFLVDEDNYQKTARARAYGNYQAEDFSVTGGRNFIDFGGGDTDRNGPYIVCNLFGSNTTIDNLSGGAGPGVWFTLEFPLDGKRHQNYQAGHFPAAGDTGDFYFAVGLGTGSNTDDGFTYYVKEVILSNDDGTKTLAAARNGLAEGAFAGYTDGMAVLRRESVDGVAAPAPAAEETGPVTITVDASRKRQTVTGFGGMANAWTSPVVTLADIDRMFGDNGLGYTILRIQITPDSAQWDAQTEIVKRAKSYGAVVLASPWTPPAALKSNGSATGGYLLPENYGAYAAHLKNFVDFMAARGAAVDVVSFQNEPDINVNYDSCDWTPEQMVDFVKGFGRSIGAARIMPGESFQFRRVFSDPLLNDPAALANFDIIGGHIYGGGLAAYPLAQEKGKEVWMTEHLLNTEGNYPYDLTWKPALVVAAEIHECMLADFNAYIWWYLKRFYSMIGDGEYGAAEGETLKRGYVLSHYAKYATGKTRIDAVTTVDGDGSGSVRVLASAYESGDDVSLVIINRGSTAVDAAIRLPFPAASAAGVETTATADMRPVTARLTGGEAAITLAPESVVSLSFRK